jgi:hypothetical protein
VTETGPRKVKDYSDRTGKPDLRGTAWWGRSNRPRDGAMSEVLKETGCSVPSSDLYQRGYGEAGVDFLNPSRVAVGDDKIIIRHCIPLPNRP